MFGGENMDYEINIYRRPERNVIRRIKEITELLTLRWFTNNVPEDTERDLMFQDVVCLSINGIIVSFIMLSFYLPLNIFSIQAKPNKQSQQIHNYYLIVDEQTQETLMYVPIVVNIGDEVLSEKNVKYIIVKIEENIAYGRKLSK